MSTYLPTYLSVFLSLISLSLYYHEEAACHPKTLRVTPS